ncbi:hypothetical protein N3K66_009086 [Trichothecium roseum]|uniref:Uncharacterized protein n=2 Tax=Trichothecium roseum TaxID=47278 RepID=A0ACC0UPF2_9HYPO|nr:hypothetical protein N3K66_009060 [Trichothecium roseum]KAI9896017.1 hypothetical protein N3K66_009086 [Trichothecium roseum]
MLCFKLSRGAIDIAKSIRTYEENYEAVPKNRIWRLPDATNPVNKPESAAIKLLRLFHKEEEFIAAQNSCHRRGTQMELAKMEVLWVAGRMGLEKGEVAYIIRIPAPVRSNSSHTASTKEHTSLLNSLLQQDLEFSPKDAMQDPENRVLNNVGDCVRLQGEGSLCPSNGGYNALVLLFKEQKLLSE